MKEDSILVSKTIDKEPYYKRLTDDKVINVTGESGSGKSTYTQKFVDKKDYIVIDTDNIFSNFNPTNEYEIKLYDLFTKMYGGDWQERKENLLNNFDYIYETILNELKDYNKIIVIDSAHFRHVKDINILRGEVIVIRTSIDNCYKRVLQRYKDKRNNYTEEEFNLYKKKKLGMYEWYKKLNEFLIKLDKM